MSEDSPELRPPTEPERGESLGGGTATISGPELEAAAERVLRRMGAQARIEGGPALPGGAASATGSVTPPTTGSLPATNAPGTSTASVSSGASAGSYSYFRIICKHMHAGYFWAILENRLESKLRGHQML